MTETLTPAELDIPTANVVARTAETITQATAVEQARAVAEVQAAIVVAQQCPRDIGKAITEMRMSCSQRALADRAFFRYNRSGSQITGPSVHLARELARCFGNVQYGIAELRRDDEAGVSEMQAFAWDVERNTRAAQVFVVPHRRDTKQGQKALTDLRDVYENNANQGARRLREAIFAILPTWFTEEAKELCSATLSKGEDGVTLPQQVANIIDHYAANGVTKDQLEEKLGRKSGQWTPHDIAQLRVIWQSIGRGEVTKDDEFPPPRVTGAEIVGNGRQREAQPAATAATRVEPSADVDLCPGGCGQPATAHSAAQCPALADSTDADGQEALV